MVQTHRCPATVSGTKSAETTEGYPLGKVQRVGICREPGDLPYMALRRPSEGKGRQRVCADPDRSRLGFFYACCFPCRVEQPSFPPCGGRGGEGEASRGSSRSVASLSPLFHRRNSVQRLALRPVCAHPSSAARKRRVLHLGTTTGIPWTTAAPRHHGRGTPVSLAAGPREGRSLALRQHGVAVRPRPSGSQ